MQCLVQKLPFSNEMTLSRNGLVEAISKVKLTEKADGKYSDKQIRQKLETLVTETNHIVKEINSKILAKTLVKEFVNFIPLHTQNQIFIVNFIFLSTRITSL